MMGRPLLHPVSVGDRFGRLEVIEIYRQRDYRNQLQIFCVCRCDCGNRKVFIKSNIQKGKSASCGCLRTEMIASRSTKHGHASRGILSPEYLIWQGMIQRCHGTGENKNFKNYKDRGIKVCERWMKFENFLADMGPRPDGTSLDRFPDNNGPYCLENCRWATKSQQARNTRKNIIITFRGESMCAAAWDERQGFPRNTVGSRIRRGWSAEKAILHPVHKKILHPVHKKVVDHV